MTATTLERKVFFYRANLKCDENGEPIPLDVTTLFKRIRKLSWVEGERYYAHGNGNLTYAKAFRKDRLLLGTSRRADLPQVEKGGKTSPLPVKNDEGVAELTHVCFYPNNIVACEYNHHGPRASRIAFLVKRWLPDFPTFELEPLISRDMSERLNSFKEVRVIDLQMTSSTAAAWVGQNDSLYAGLKAMEEAGKTTSVQVVLKAEKAASLPKVWLRKLRDFVKKPDLIEEAKRLKVSYVAVDGTKDEVDLLSDKLLAKCTVTKMNDRTKGVSRAEMYREMDKAYAELRTELEAASSLIVSRGTQ